MPKQAPEQYEISPLKLWSSLRRYLAACGQTKGSSQQWIGTIRNLQKKGVSAVEIEWSEILSLLGDDAESDLVFNALSALAADLEGNPARERAEYVPPVLLIDELLDFLDDRPPCDLVLQRHITDEYAPLVHYVKQQRPAKLPPIAIRNGRREVCLLHYRDRTFGLCIWLHTEFDKGLFARHSYWSFSIPRGRKKVAPNQVKRDFRSAQEAMAYGRVLVERMSRRLKAEGFTGQTRSLNFFPSYVLPGGLNYTEWLITAPNVSEEYWGPHFNIPNIVAHVRTTERISPQGARLLVLEEIQSDWNQELRAAIQKASDQHLEDEVGNVIIEWDDDLNPPPLNPYLNHWLEAALRMMLLYAANQGYAGIAWLPGKLHAERFSWANAEGLKTFYDRIVSSAVEKLAKSWGAQLAAAQIPTMSRNFIVREVTGKAKWRVLNRDSGIIVGEEFTDRYKAEEFRMSSEVPVLESVTALYISDEMRADIRKNGLPYLGAIGKRSK